MTCTPTTLESGQTSQCTATVTGTGNYITTVTYAASVGSIDTTGLYSAPPVNVATQVTITAISNQDTTKTATVTLTVNPVTAIVVTCTPTVIQSLQNSLCVARANGNITTAVNWTSSIGVISTSGQFTAPTVPSTTTATITATTQVTNVVGTATVTVNVNNTRGARHRRRAHRERRVHRLPQRSLRHRHGLRAQHHHLLDHRSRTCRHRLGRIPRSWLRARQPCAHAAERLRRQSDGRVLRRPDGIRLGTGRARAGAGLRRNRVVDSHRGD